MLNVLFSDNNRKLKNKHVTRNYIYMFNYIKIEIFCILKNGRKY